MSKDEKKKLESGMYECEILKGGEEGSKVIYHSSTAETLEAKGFVKVGKKIQKHIPKTMKE